MASPLVVLTDFHAVTNRALSYAAGLAEPLQAKLVLLHARYDALLAPLDDDLPYAPLNDQATDRALQRLANAQPVPTLVEVSERELPEAVRAAVLHHHPLLLVLGQPGGASTPAEVLTSTAETLLSTVPYPLLLLPALGDWQAAPPRRLLLAVDGQPFVLHQYQDVLRQLLGVADGTLAVVRVADSSHGRLGVDAILRTVATHDLTDELAPELLSEVDNISVVGGVLAEAARQHTDLLVVVARRHSLLGRLFHRSVTAQLIEQSPIPLLVLPAQD
ncbi:universal stress protein [Hymenobacter amundsenii]|nr:universal stress protein [Hymenobacter amundsenii]